MEGFERYFIEAMFYSLMLLLSYFSILDFLICICYWYFLVCCPSISLFLTELPAYILSNRGICPNDLVSAGCLSFSPPFLSLSSPFFPFLFI